LLPITTSVGTSATTAANDRNEEFFKTCPLPRRVRWPRLCTITINTRTRTYRSRHPGKKAETLHRLRLEGESGRTLRIYKDDKAIDVVVDDDGLLRLTADKMVLRFVCVYEGHDLRICPGCLAKIPVSILICNECDWCFGSTF